MIRFATISYFRERLLDLLKVKKGVYSTVEDEIRREFLAKPIEEIRINNDMVLMEGDMVIIKLRLPDKKHRLARKDGFRLVYMVSKIVPMVAFLDIYPKNGPLQQLNEPDSELIRLVRLFISESENGVLEDYQM